MTVRIQSACVKVIFLLGVLLKTYLVNNQWEIGINKTYKRLRLRLRLRKTFI